MPICPTTNDFSVHGHMREAQGEEMSERDLSLGGSGLEIILGPREMPAPAQPVARGPNTGTAGRRASAGVIVATKPSPTLSPSTTSGQRSVQAGSGCARSQVRPTSLSV